MVGLTIVLCIVGLVMVLSSSSVEALRKYGSAWVFFERQVMWVALGGAALWFSSRVDYRRWRRFGRALLVVSVGLLLLVLVPGIGISVSGSTRWLGYGPLQFQPSEFAKLGVLLYLADLLDRRSGQLHDAKLTLYPVVAILAAVGGLVMLQPDMGTTIVITSIVIAVQFVAGTPMGALIAQLMGMGLVGMGYGLVAPYRRARLMCFLHPAHDAAGKCYQLSQSLVGLGTGNIVGVGLGASRAKWGFLPNAHTDFIFSIIGEELGLIGAAVVVGLFAGFAWLGVRAALRAPDRFGVLVAAGVTAWVIGQAVLNIGAVIGILPVTGVPLPFVSFGGSSLVITMFAVGILANVARQEKARRA
ncbi:MAG: putative lipid flippase FtsW [Acidimicrobiales bacterium]|jgi:cell division protein FtsW|nr:putative lipid flippase FtsW [Acidimicrobiales bacterium]